MISNVPLEKSLMIWIFSSFFFLCHVFFIYLEFAILWKVHPRKYCANISLPKLSSTTFDSTTRRYFESVFSYSICNRYGRRNAKYSGFFFLWRNLMGKNEKKYVSFKLTRSFADISGRVQNRIRQNTPWPVGRER